MAKVLLDCSLLSRPYGLKRCTYQLMHMALIAVRLGHDVRLLTSDQHVKKHKFLSKYADNILVYGDKNYEWPDIYIAKSDAFYVDHNWDMISNLPAFKVCLCNSDKCFRESDIPYRSHRGTAVHTRCDLYMPANHTDSMIGLDHVIPIAHPIDPRMVELFRSTGVYSAYLDDDISKLRSFFMEKETRKLGFMGSREPKSTRISISSKFPKWVDFKWVRTASSRSYLSWMMKRRGCLDLRGFGDKSLRFTEAVLFGKTIVTSTRVSQYLPPLVDGHNCVIYTDETNLTYDKQRWKVISEAATHDYISNWSIRAQMMKIISTACA